MAEFSSCALVLLAAGASRRMGRPKQLLPVDGQPLLRGVAEAAVNSRVAQVIVVLGASAEEIRSSLDGLPVCVVVHEGWEEGMGSSVRVGMEKLTSLAVEINGVIIALGDQPGFSAGQVNRLLEVQRQTGRSMVASQSKGRLMPPAFFAREHFPALLALRGDAGARGLLQAHADEVAVVEAGDLADLDTPADYAEFLKGKAAAGSSLH